MFLKYCSLITVISVFLFSDSFSQYNKKNLTGSSYIYVIGTQDIKTLGIDSITVYKFLSDSLKKAKYLNTDIFSKKASFYYSDGKLVRDSWSYSGIDSSGTDHLKERKGPFTSLPYVYENYYTYKGDSLIRVDQNSPFKKFTTDMIVIKNAGSNQIFINGMNMIKFRQLFLKTDKDEFLIEISKSLSLYFNLVD